MSVLGIKFCLFLIGFLSGPQVICFSMGAEMSLENAKASAMATVNMIVTLVGGILQPVVGFILDCLCRGHSDEIVNYNAYAFKWALLTMPIIIIIGFFLTFGLKNKNSEII
jgi:MFS family permease